MRTNVEIPKDTLMRAKKYAEDRGVSLDDLINRSIEDCLPSPKQVPLAERIKVVAKTFGMLSHLHAETERINKIIEEG